MSFMPLFGSLALAALLPAALLSRGQLERGAMAAYWGSVLLAVAGPTIWAIAQHGDGWRTGLAPALWLAIAISAVLFAALAAIDPVVRRLTPLLVGYLVLLGLVALAWQPAPGRPLRAAVWPAWLQVHILVALVSYGLLTLAAVAGAGVVLQERALRRKQPTAFTRSLPAIVEGERLQTALLLAVEIVLGLTLVTGVVLNREEGLSWLTADHKTVLSMLAFAVIGVLLVLHVRFGLSGRRAARYGLLAYLLVTLAYPGVKFVTDVVMRPGA